MDTGPSIAKRQTSADPKKLADLLSDYKTPMKVESNAPVNNQQTQPVNSQQSQPQQFYVRGPKKGQPKPPGYNRPSIQVTPPQQQGQVSGEFISGAILLLLIDFLFPIIFVFLNNKFAKKKIEMELLQLTEKQQKALTPVADALAKEIRMNGSPFVVFPLMLLCMYGSNYAMLKMMDK